MTYYWWIHWFWITSLNVYYCFPFSSVDTYQQQEKIYSKREPLKFPMAVQSDTDDIFDGREITDAILRDTTKWQKQNVIIPRASTSIDLMSSNINQILENVSDNNAVVKQTITDKTNNSPAVTLTAASRSPVKPTTTSFQTINYLSLTNKTSIDINGNQDNISNPNNSNYINNKSKNTINVASNDLKNSTIIRTPATLILQSATITTAMDDDNNNNNNTNNYLANINNNNKNNDSDNNSDSDFNNVLAIDNINNNKDQNISDSNNTSPSSSSSSSSVTLVKDDNNMIINISKLEIVSDKYNKKLATISQMNNKYNNNNNNDNNFTVTNNLLMTNVRKNEETINFTTTTTTESITSETETEKNRISKILSQYKELNFVNFSTENKNVLARSAASAPITSDLDDGSEDNLTSEALSIKPTNVLVAGAISGICIGVIGLFGFTTAVIVILYRRRYMNNPQTLSEPDSSGYIDDSTIRENSDEMYSLDNDSFLNSLEAMTIQNYWTDSVKHTKL